MQQSKTCTKCLQIKSLNQFSKHNGKKSSKSGLRAACKECEITAYKKYREKNCDKVRESKKKYLDKNKDKKANWDKKYYEKNKESIKEYHSQWYALNRENQLEKSKFYRQNNRDKKAESDKRWALANKDKVNANSRRWRANNPEKARLIRKNNAAKNPWRARLKAHKRRDRIKAAGAFLVTTKDVKNILAKSCFYCGSKSEHLDHIVPIARGGVHSVGNLIGACKKCNQSKGSKFITEWNKVRSYKEREKWH